MVTLSQFRCYSSSDWGAPQLNGLSGSLLTLLNACLVDGYGSGSLYKAPIGWLKPIPDQTGQAIGVIQQPSGSGCILFVHDAAPFSSSVAWTREAWVCGYEEILGLTGSSYTKIMGTGAGQFPYENQAGLTALPHAGNTGSLSWRKSATLNNTERPWILYGDAHTFYLFLMKGDTANRWSMYMFGDIFSFRKTRDAYKCCIMGRLSSAAGDSYSYGDTDYGLTIDFVSYPFYIVRTAGGGRRATRANRIVDAGRLGITSGDYILLDGRGTAPGTVDGLVSVGHILVGESENSTIRGKMRGLWTWPHNVGNIQDGQVITGTGETAGRTFVMISPSTNVGQWLIETSNTVETNAI